MSVHSAPPPNQQDPEIFEDVHFGQQFLSNLKREMLTFSRWEKWPWNWS